MIYRNDNYSSKKSYLFDLLYYSDIASLKIGIGTPKGSILLPNGRDGIHNVHIFTNGKDVDIPKHYKQENITITSKCTPKLFFYFNDCDAVPDFVFDITKLQGFTYIEFYRSGSTYLINIKNEICTQEQIQKAFEKFDEVEEE